MSLCRPAIRRIALVIVGAAGSLHASASNAQDSLFGPPGGDLQFAPSDRSASQAARDELTQARLALVRARIASVQVARVTEAALRDGDAFRDLQTAAARACGQYHEARRPPLASLARDADYARLDERRESIRREIRRVADAHRDPIGRLLPLARRAMDAGQRMTRSEVIALASDPNVEEARAAMTIAYARLRRAGQSYRERVAEEPAVISARVDVRMARQRVDEANRRLVMALRMDAAIERRNER